MTVTSPWRFASESRSATTPALPKAPRLDRRSKIGHFYLFISLTYLCLYTHYLQFIPRILPVRLMGKMLYLITTDYTTLIPPLSPFVFKPLCSSSCPLCCQTQPQTPKSSPQHSLHPTHCLPHTLMNFIFEA